MFISSAAIQSTKSTVSMGNLVCKIIVNLIFADIVIETLKETYKLINLSNKTNDSSSKLP